ncbi:hypothetical protein N8762_00200 [Candidatus Marinamargulisbacteria bacterium]|nr:hypothetical protein [Candidatus Marinamargulisbacteria bacterium]
MPVHDFFNEHHDYDSLFDHDEFELMLDSLNTAMDLELGKLDSTAMLDDAAEDTY